MKKRILILIAGLLVLAVAATAISLGAPPRARITSLVLEQSADVRAQYFPDGFSANALRGMFPQQRYWCMEYLNSDMPDDYSFVTITAHVRNRSPLTFLGGEFEIAEAEQNAERFICIMQAATCNLRGAQQQDVRLTVCMNTRGLSVDDIAAAVRGLTLRSRTATRTVFGKAVDVRQLTLRVADAEKIELQWGV